MGRLGRIVVLVSSLFAAALLAQSPSTNGPHGATPYRTWTTYGGGAHSSQYAALDQINKSNVHQLDAVWTFPVAGTVIFNPVVVRCARPAAHQHDAGPTAAAEVHTAL